MLFQYDIYDFMGILDFIIIVLQLIAFCSLVSFGISRTKNNDAINKSVMFPIAGIINIIYLAIYERINFLIYRFAPGILEQIMAQSALRVIVPNILLLITFGVLFLFLGIKNS
ncbi:MAG: hypothetical protein ACW990_20000, partial [Promethearchaeota archaeon]